MGLLHIQFSHRSKYSFLQFSHCICFFPQLPLVVSMALEAYTSQNTDKIHTDVLSQARISCYKARDAFYSCLEKQSSKKPTEIATVGLLYPVECKKTREEYVKQCRPTWVKHFDRQYCAKRGFRDFWMIDDSRRGV